MTQDSSPDRHSKPDADWLLVDGVMPWTALPGIETLDWRTTEYALADGVKLYRQRQRSALYPDPPDPRIAEHNAAAINAWHEQRRRARERWKVTTNLSGDELRKRALGLLGWKHDKLAALRPNTTRDDDTSRAIWYLAGLVNDNHLQRDEVMEAILDASQASLHIPGNKSETQVRDDVNRGLDKAPHGFDWDRMTDRPGWKPPDEYAASVRSAGAKAKAKNNSQAAEPGDDDGPSLLDTLAVTGDWLDAQHFADLEYVVPELLPEGLGYLGAPPKKGKSFLVGNIALAVASGGLALGRIRVKQRPVLVLALEDGHRRLQDRFRKMNAGQPIPADLTLIIRATPLEALAVMAEYLKRHRDAKPLVILDTLGKVKRGKLPGEDSYQADYAISAQLKALADAAPGSTILVVHHTRKAAADDFVETLSGTYGIAGAADYVMVLQRSRGSDDGLLCVTGRDILESEYALHADDGILWRLNGENLDESRGAAETVAAMNKLLLKHGRLSVDVWHYVNDDQRIVTPAEIAAEFNLDRRRASEILSRLANDGSVTKLLRGEYGPA